MINHYCFVWDASPTVIASHILANVMTFVAYMIISLSLYRVYGVVKPKIPFSWEVGGFAAFIFLCGLTHIATVLTTFFPSAATYTARTLVDEITGLVSLYVAYVVVFKFAFLMKWLRLVDRTMQGDVPIEKSR